MKVKPMDYMDRMDRIEQYPTLLFEKFAQSHKKKSQESFFFKIKKLHLQFRSLEDYEHLVNEPALSGWALFFA